MNQILRYIVVVLALSSTISVLLESNVILANSYFFVQNLYIVNPSVEISEVQKSGEILVYFFGDIFVPSGHYDKRVRVCGLNTQVCEYATWGDTKLVGPKVVSTVFGKFSLPNGLKEHYKIEVLLFPDIGMQNNTYLWQGIFKDVRLNSF